MFLRVEIIIFEYVLELALSSTESLWNLLKIRHMGLTEVSLEPCVELQPLTLTVFKL